MKDMRLDMSKFAVQGIKVVAKMITQHAAWESADPRALLVDSPPHAALPPPTGSASPTPVTVELATTSDTLEELKRRLGKELYKLELDLQGGLRIAGKPCDCASAKHNFGVEATAEELIAYEKNPIYGQVIDWYRSHLPEFQPSEIIKHPESHYQSLVPELRAFRKQVMGTEKLSVLVSPREREAVVARASEIIKQRMETTDDNNL